MTYQATEEIAYRDNLWKKI